MVIMCKKQQRDHLPALPPPVKHSVSTVLCMPRAASHTNTRTDPCRHVRKYGGDCLVTHRAGTQGKVRSRHRVRGRAQWAVQSTAPCLGYWLDSLVSAPWWCQHPVQPPPTAPAATLFPLELSPDTQYCRPGAERSAVPSSCAHARTAVLHHSSNRPQKHDRRSQPGARACAPFVLCECGAVRAQNGCGGGLRICGKTTHLHPLLGEPARQHQWRRGGECSQTRSSAEHAEAHRRQWTCLQSTVVRPPHPPIP